MTRIALITGAGSGIGRAGARMFAQRGIAVVGVDRDAAGLDETAAAVKDDGGRIHTIAFDLAEIGSIKALIDGAADVFGGVDILWNNAGINGPEGMGEHALDFYVDTVNVNMNAGILASNAVVPHMRARGGGSILFTSSVSGLVGSSRYAVYAATKFGVIGYAKSLAVQLGGDRIRANVICPGGVQTPMADRLAQQTASLDGVNYRDARLRTVPLERISQPEEIAEAAYWLSSDAASYITGVALPVDGGYTAK